MQRRFEIVKSILQYSSSAYLSQIVGLISGVLIARLLGPEEFGIWNVVMLVLGYATYTELGVLSAMGRDLPLHLGQGDLKKASAVEGAARYVTIFGAVLTAVIIGIFSFFGIHSLKMSIGLQVTALVLILQQIYTYHRIHLRSYNRFKELSRQQVIFSLLTAFTGILLVFLAGLEGRLFAAFLAHLLILVYAVRRDPWKSIEKFDWAVTKSLLRVGIPIIFSGIIITMLTSIDRLMIITFLDEKQLGYFGLGIMLVGAVSIVPAMAIQVLVPKINFLYGSSGMSIESLRSYVLKPSLVLSLALPLVIGPVFLLLPFIVQSFMPEFIPGISSARIVVLGTFFYGILGLTDTFLVTVGKLKQYAVMGCSVLIFNLVLDLIFIKSGLGIEGVACAGTLITYFFYSSIIIGYALSHYSRDLQVWAKYFIRLWFPFIYMVVVLYFIDLIDNFVVIHLSQVESLALAFFEVILYLLFSAPLIYLVLRELKYELETLNKK
jgi:O-antigen/teichoic acid export membrane protein